MRKLYTLLLLAGTFAFSANAQSNNNKEVLPVGDIDTSQALLTYTINFQNTGSATAQNLVILDTLDGNLDSTTVQVLGSSHAYTLTMHPGGIAAFAFTGINLVDSLTDAVNSVGYIEFTVAIIDTTAPGTVISNTAHIAFDAGTPIVTNTTQNRVVIAIPVPTVTASDTVVCMGDSITFRTNSSPYYTSFQWLRNGVAIPNTNDTVFVARQSGSYGVRAFNGTNFETSDSIAITVNPLPLVSVSVSNNLICSDGSDATITTTPSGGTLTGTGVTGNIFSPSVGVGTYVINYSYTDTNGCTSMDTTHIAVSQKPVAAFALPTDHSICSDSVGNYTVLDIYASPIGGIFYGDSVVGGHYIHLADTGDFVFNYVYTDIYGCADTVQGMITVENCVIDTTETGIEWINSGFSVYPNPANTLLNINATIDLTGKTIALVDLNGRLVIKENAIGQTMTLNVENLDRGMYFLLISDNHTILSRKKVVLVR